MKSFLLNNLPFMIIEGEDAVAMEWFASYEEAGYFPQWLTAERVAQLLEQAPDTATGERWELRRKTEMPPK